jgi:hypothetical protein
VTSTGAQLHPTMQGRVTERYEILRAAALGTALPPEARSGLAILLQRGMWAWVRAILQAPCQCSSAAAPRAAGLPVAREASERRTVIHLLAAMVMAIPERRRTA